MPDTTLLLSQLYVKIGGAPASDPMMLNLVEATVDESLHLPDVATLVLHDPNGQWVDDANLAPGKTLEISAKSGSDQHPIFDGEIVELESDFLPGDRRVIIRGFDRLHRLARGRQVRSFLNTTDGDIVTKIAGEVGLTPKIGSTSTVHEYVLQDNITNLDFLRQRAALLGYLVFVEGKELHFEKHGEQSASLTLTFGEDLREFHPRMTTIDQVSAARASGWDPKKKEPVLGEAQRGNGAPTLESGKQGGQVSSEAFSLQARIQVADRPIRAQNVAQVLAQASLDRRAGRFVEAEGTTRGTPNLVAGASLEIKKLGTRFSGKYFVTSTTHSYTADAGYVTRFVVSGFQPSGLLSMLGPERDGLAAPRIGLVVGVVTDNNDPEDMGRVKVKYPWLTQDHASDWARVVVPGGGSLRGMEFLPEVNDEVLVGFEQGDINYPYVIGGLWNGVDKPPRKNSEIVEKSGKVKQRIIRSRTGHILTLDDSDDAPSISIVDQTGKNLIKFDSKANKLTVHFEGDMLLEAPNGDVAIRGKTITATATEGVTVKGKSLDAFADTTVDIKANSDLKLKGANAEMQANANLSVKGAQAEVQASARLTLNGGGMTQVQGGMIQVG